jgi:hypothetical protein
MDVDKGRAKVSYHSFYEPAKEQSRTGVLSRFLRGLSRRESWIEGPEWNEMGLEFSDFRLRLYSIASTCIGRRGVLYHGEKRRY